MFDAKILKTIKNTITTDVIPLFCLIFNNNCTGVHVIDAIEGVYDDNAAKDTNKQGGQKGTIQNFREIIKLSKAKY